MSLSNLNGKGRQRHAGLAELGRDALAKVWVDNLGTEVPKGMSQPMLVRILAWELQAKQCGGHKPATRRALKRASCDQKPSSSTSFSTRPGSRLVREWNGRTHTVDVRNDGFCWEGRSYKSLSAIARDITGTKWSGPRFFGLTGGRS